MLAHLLATHQLHLWLHFFLHLHTFPAQPIQKESLSWSSFDSQTILQILQMFSEFFGLGLVFCRFFGVSWVISPVEMSNALEVFKSLSRLTSIWWPSVWYDFCPSPGDYSQNLAKPETNWYKAKFGVVGSLNLCRISCENPTRRYFGEICLWLVE